MSEQIDPARGITSFVAMGTLAALAGCGGPGEALHAGPPVSGDGGTLRGEQPSGPFSAVEADDGLATAAGYSRVFERHGLALDAIRFGAPAPRLFATRLPEDMEALGDIDLRRSVFIATVLPIVLDVNARIRLERARILAIAGKVAEGEPVHDFDRGWIDRMALRYGADDLRELLRRVDEIPPSLAIAQAAIESGWGTSRFARDGNALFGQRLTGDEGGLRPAGYESDPGFRVASFPDLTASVEAYAHNLNTYPAYDAFRLRRARQREAADGRPLDGHALAATMHRYAARGWGYVVMARSVIRDNRLEPLDGARLRSLASRRPEMADAAH